MSYRHTEPTHAEIALAAFYLWRRSGYPSGQDVTVWLSAEQTLRHEQHRRERDRGFIFRRHEKFAK